MVVNDRHPSGVPSPDDSGSGFSYGTPGADYGQSAYGAYGADAYPADSHGGYPVGAYGSSPDVSYASYGDDDPLFGTLPGTETAHSGTGAGTGGYADAAWQATSGWDDGGYGVQTGTAPSVPVQPGPEQADFGYPAGDDGTGQWGSGVQETAAWDTASWPNGGWEAPGWDGAGWDTGSSQAAAYAYEPHGGYEDQGGYGAPAGYEAPAAGYEAQAAAYDAQAGYGDGSQDGYAAYEHAPYDGYGYGYDAEGGHAPAAPVHGHPHDPTTGRAGHGNHGGHGDHGGHGESVDPSQETTASWDFSALAQEHSDGSAYGHGAAHGHEQAGEDVAGQARDRASGWDPEWADADALGDLGTPGAPEDPDGPAGADGPDAPVSLGTLGGPHPRGRRRSPKARPRRRALMTVAVPSVAVMGVAGAAAASVMGGGDDSKDGTTTVAAPDAAPVKPSHANNKLDSQLAGLSADAGDFADRASRTQERIDLKQRQEAEKERKAKEAARKEAMRPKFVIPVKNHALSARYGQAGVNWMSLHTGIDFPVSYGTPVMAATDGTVSTKYDTAYGNMAIVTAKDGTETWYCHLSSNKIRSGQVKAGDVIAYSGNSGNSTGPHLHFEVRPGGGSAVDPIPWLQSKGLHIG
nr:M23 family metallopeptidase [Streptomyces albus]